jgi:peptidoglycan/LPS O-acetylase OafA/YrhL
MSGPRATIYALGAALIAVFAYYTGATSEEVALWAALLAATIPFGALVLATVKTWPRKPKAESDNA